MEIDAEFLYGVATGAVIPFILWGLNKWKQINADGTISIDEVIDAVEEGQEEIEKVADAVEKAKDKKQ